MYVRWDLGTGPLTRQLVLQNLFMSTQEGSFHSDNLKSVEIWTFNKSMAAIHSDAPIYIERMFLMERNDPRFGIINKYVLWMKREKEESQFMFRSEKLEPSPCFFCSIALPEFHLCFFPARFDMMKHLPVSFKR